MKKLSILALVASVAATLAIACGGDKPEVKDPTAAAGDPAAAASSAAPAAPSAAPTAAK